MPWLLNEDAALRFKLQGLTVSDANNSARPVIVRYKNPESEVADLDFPCIIIDHDGWYPAYDRMHDGVETLPYAPEGQPTWYYDPGDNSPTPDPNDSPYYPEWFPVAYNFDYTITLYSRFMHEHTMPLVSTLSGFDYFHPRYAYLNIPQDGTKRTLQVLGGPELSTGKDKNGKRMFWVDWKIRIFGELVPQLIQPTLANMVNLDLSVYNQNENLTIGSVTEAKGLLSVGVSSSWNVAQPIT